MNIDALSEQSVLAVLKDLIRIPSVNPSLACNEPSGEQAIAQFSCGWFVDHGVKSWTEEVESGRPNVLAEIGRGDGPTLVLCAHVDTVSATEMTIPPFDPVVSEGRVYGRGSYDMKGGAAALMSAVVALSKEKLKGRVLAALVADEEYTSLGASNFVKNHAADACILTEPSDGQLIVAHKGFVWIEIVTSGRAAHGSRWDLGESAIGKMGRIVAALECFDGKTLRFRTHSLVGPASLHCATIEGGIGPSTYAERCVMRIERRTLPGEIADSIVQEVRDVIASVGEIAELRVLLSRSPLSNDPNSEIADCLKRAVREVVGTVPADAGVSYWMDAAIFAEAGISTVNFGGSGAGAHAAVEWADLNSVVTCARVLAQTARSYVGVAKQ